MPRAKQRGGCEPLFPHRFIRVNTIFEVAKAFGLHTAWSDKHLAYELVNGPSGHGVDDFFAPEINSDPSKSLIPSASPGGAFTDKWTYTETYDDFKVQAILNEIEGRWSDDGLPGAADTAGPRPGTPAIFGMNFQALSVAQKDSSADGGYVGAAGEPGARGRRRDRAHGRVDRQDDRGARGAAPDALDAHHRHGQARPVADRQAAVPSGRR